MPTPDNINPDNTNDSQPFSPITEFRGNIFDSRLRARIIEDAYLHVADKESKPRTIKVMGPDEERAMSLALDVILSNQREALRMHNLPQERRESEYLALAVQDQRHALTADEIRYSEQPVHLGDISWELLKSIARDGHKDLLMDKDNLQIVCSTCATRIPNFFAFFCLDSVYCSQHMPNLEECVNCHNVRTDCGEFKTPEGEMIWVCGRCQSGGRCTECSNPLPPGMTLSGQCLHHYQQIQNNRFPRNFSRNNRWMSDKLGTFVQTPRIFSAELEVVLPNEARINNLLDSIPRELGAGGDSSINSHLGFGIELQTPRLSGIAGEELILRTTAALQKIGATTNNSCGFHIHLDGAGVLPKSRKEYPLSFLQLWKAHLVFEDVILSFLPFGRRLNRYCRPMRDYFKFSELSLITSMFEAEKLWYKQRRFASLAHDKSHHYHPSRYFGVNLHSLLGNRNLEIRYHTGTINAKKIFHWVNLHALIMDAAASGLFTGGFLDEAQATMDIKEKAQILFERIGLNNKSQRYFLERQRKFGDKTAGDDETVETPSVRLRSTISNAILS